MLGALGEVNETLRLCNLVVGERGLLKEKASRELRIGDPGALTGGSGAGLGLENRSGSSATSSKPGLKGVAMGMAELSGVVRACPT